MLGDRVSQNNTVVNFRHNSCISTTALENVIDELQRQNAELQELLRNMSDSM